MGKFKVGDKVVVDGRVGEVEAVLDSLHGYRVQYPNGKIFYERADDVKAALTFTATSPTTVTLPSTAHWPVGTVLPYDPNTLFVTETPPANQPNPKKRFGAQKPDLALVPPASTLHEAMALEAGAKKYGGYNWRKDPVESMTYVAAAMRHIQNWLDGEEYCADDDTVHNLGAAKAGLGILLDAMELGNLIDNRPPAGASSQVQERMKAAKVARAEGEKK